MRWTNVQALVLAGVVSAGCYAMVPVTLDDVSTERPHRVWITRPDQSQVIVSGPQVFGDTLVGYIAGQFHEVPVQEVRRVEIRRSARGKTMALVGAGILGAAAVGILISGTGTPAAVSMVDCNDVPEDPRCQGQIP